MHAPGDLPIKDLIALREQSPSRAAALARARVKLSSALAGDCMSIAQLRLSKGLSQGGLAKLMDVHQPYVARLERGDDMQVSTLKKVADALEVSPTVVLEAIFAGQRNREAAK